MGRDWYGGEDADWWDKGKKTGMDKEEVMYLSSESESTDESEDEVLKGMKAVLDNLELFIWGEDADQEGLDKREDIRYLEFNLRYLTGIAKKAGQTGRVREH